MYHKITQQHYRSFQHRTWLASQQLALHYVRVGATTKTYGWLPILTPIAQEVEIACLARIARLVKISPMCDSPARPAILEMEQI